MFGIKSLRNNPRFFILAGSILVSLLIFGWFALTIPTSDLYRIKLQQIYALLALLFLYLTLLATPLTQAFPKLPFGKHYLFIRRALGVSALYFAWLHASISFFGQLGGFAGLGFLNQRFIIAISCSFTALIILSLMGATAFDKVIDRLSFKRWKMLHRLIYLAAILILIHAIMLGSHFVDLYGDIPSLLLAGLIILLSLEGLRAYHFLGRKYPDVPGLGAFALIGCGVLLVYVGHYVGQAGSTGGSLGVHSQHQASQPHSHAPSGNESGKRFTTSFDHPDVVNPGEDTQLSFRVFDASAGHRVTDFKQLYERQAHLIIVDSSLEQYSHVHPDLISGAFQVTTQFHKPGRYHIYLSYQPTGSDEQQIAFTLDVGTSPEVAPATLQPDTSPKTVGNYQIKLSTGSLRSADITAGRTKLSFTITDTSGNPLANLQPYLAAFGHLVMINQETYEYLHVHPGGATPKPDDTGGPTVEFTPAGHHGPVKAGLYRLFLQLNPGGNLIQTAYTIQVES